jgi:hypothetical protein
MYTKVYMILDIHSCALNGVDQQMVAGVPLALCLYVNFKQTLFSQSYRFDNTKTKITIEVYVMSHTETKGYVNRKKLRIAALGLYLTFKILRILLLGL